jgi:ABC-2 type transport system permease protein
MNIFDKGLLAIILLPKRIYQKAGIDVPKLKSILIYKLMMDDRNPTSIQNLRNKNKTQKKDPSNISYINMFLNLVTGSFFMLVFLIGENHIIHLTLYFSIFIIFLSMMLISNFTSVLIDVRDNYIILPKPVNGETVVLARLLHIFIYMCKTILPLSIPAIIFISINENIMAGLLLFIIVIFATLFSIFLISAVYIFILKITTPEKFKNIISYIQIVFAILIYAAYQLVPRLISKIGFENINLANIKWVILMPSYWFACLFNGIFTLNASKIEIIAALLGILVPIVSMYLVIKYLAPYFNQKLSMISGSEGVNATSSNPIKKNSKPIDETLVGFVTNNPMEKAGFLFSWKMMARSREYKMAIYPTIGYVFVMFILILLTGYKNSMDLNIIMANKVKLTSQIIIGIYVSSIILLAAITQIVYTEKYKAAWIYFSTPIVEPGQIISGGIKAVIIQLNILISLVFLIISIALIGFSIMPNIILGMINQILIAYIIAALAKKNFPFSRHLLNAKKSSSFIKSLYMLLIYGIIGVIHFYILKNIYLILISIAISLILIYFTSKYIKNLTWNEIDMSTD